jgi:RNA-directed DNA polymerase
MDDLGRQLLLPQLWQVSPRGGYRLVLSFDNIDRGKLREVLHQKINDGGITRLLGKWFHAGIMESGQLSVPDKGTPQGSVVSPILANVFLHTVLDTWFETEVKPRMKGRCFMVRYCDDFIMGFELKTDAERLYEVLPKRFEKYSLELNMMKTKLVQFGRPSKGASKGSNTFDFLGFTHYWGKSMKGHWIIKRKTQGKTMRLKMADIYQWCRENMHKPIATQYEKLVAKLLGHYQYYGIRGNYKMLEVFFEHVETSWKYWLGRRTRNGHIKWDKFENVYRKHLPLPKPRITQTC